MKYFVIFASVVYSCSSLAHVPLQNAVGKRLMVLQNISVPAFVNGVHFQNGKQVGVNGYEIKYQPATPTCFLGIAYGEAWRSKKDSTVISAGTTFTLIEAYPVTAQIQDAPAVAIGSVFRTNSNNVIELQAIPNANGFAAAADVRAKPDVLDATILEQCFGNLIAITK